MIEAYINLILFAFLMLGTPGPATLAVAAIGAVFGIRQGMLFVAGLLLGFAFVLIIESWGLSKLFTQYPQAKQYLQWFGLAYVIYLAFKISTADSGLKQGKMSQAPGWLDGFILNVTNPKAYVAVLVIYTQFLLPHDNTITAYMITGVVCFVLVLLIDSVWLFLGQLLRPLFNRPKTAKIIRWVFAVSMVLAVVLIVLFSE